MHPILKWEAAKKASQLQGVLIVVQELILHSMVVYGDQIYGAGFC